MATKEPKYRYGSPEHREFLRQIASTGGERNKERRLKENPNYFKEMAQKGGQAKAAKYPREHFAAMGRVGGRAKRKSRSGEVQS